MKIDFFFQTQESYVSRLSIHIHYIQKMETIVPWPKVTFYRNRFVLTLTVLCPVKTGIDRADIPC